MALQVWLPLIKDLTNYGLANVTVTSNAVTQSTTEGKLGTSYSFNGSTTWIKTTMPSTMKSLKNSSVCMWIKSTASVGAGGGIMHNDSNAYACMCLYTSGWQMVTGSAWKYISTGTFTNTSVWHHVACTIDDTKIRTYLDGVLVTETTIAAQSVLTDMTDKNFIGLGCDFPGGDEYFTGFINDFRVYDHCLSKREIKEISKGLVCHYLLNCNGLGIPNLVDNSSTFTGWSAGSGWTKSISDDGTAMYSFSRTGATGNNWVRLIPTLQVNGNNYPNGITVSLDILTPDKSAINQKCVGSLQTYQANASRIGWVEPQWNLDNVVNNQWSRISYTFNQTQLLNNNTSGTTYAYTMFSFQLVQNGDISIRKIMIAEGNAAQSYMLSVNDMNATKELDTSGYQNDGTKTNITYSTDSPRYSLSSVFNGTNSFVLCGRGGMVKDEITLSLWAYMDDWITPVTQNTKIYRPISCAESGGWSFRPDDDKTRFRMSVGVGTSSNSYIHNYMPLSNLTSGWHMLSLTYNGLRSRIYLDGNFISEAGTLTTKTPLFYNSTNSIYIGTEATASSYDSAGCFPGKISDVRIYATALSDADIKELYQAPINFNKHSVMTQGEFVEK